MINPILRNRHYLNAYLSFWLAIMLILTALLHWSESLSFYEAGITSFVYTSTFGIVGLSIWFVVRFSGLDQGNILNGIATHTAAAALLLSIWLYFARGISALINGTEWHPLDISSFNWWWIVFGSFFYIIVALIYYLIIFYHNYRDKQMRESEMKMMLKESELSMLKAQINPHFIFNSLNSISTLTLTNPNNAHEMIIKLSTFLRHTIGQSETDLVPLKQEIETIQLYLDIEKSRFGDKLEVNISEIEGLQDQITIPNLILQPLVENAIKYGVYESTEKSAITINISLTGHLLTIKICNQIETDGVPMKGKGIGLSNVKSRLQLIYGRMDLLRTEHTETTFEVTIIIPQNHEG